MDKFNLLILVIGEDSIILDTTQKEYLNFKQQFALDNATLVLIFAGKRANRIIAGQPINEIDKLPSFDDSEGILNIVQAIRKWTYEAQVNMYSFFDNVRTAIFVDVSDEICKSSNINHFDIVGGFDETEYFFATERGKGLKFQHTYVSSIERLETSANAGDEDAQYKLGIIYAKGEGTEKDLIKAQSLFYKASLRGNKDALFALIDFFDNPQQFHCESAAKLGHLRAQWLAGKKYYDYLERGEGTNKDLEKAKYWLTKAAEQGHQEAIKMLNYILN